MVTDLSIRILRLGPFRHGSFQADMQAFEAGLECIQAVPVIRVSF